MTDKTRVKDLAEELNLSMQDMRNIIKELSIQAKVGHSVLADEEIERIKDRVHNGPQKAARSSESSDVIVRRRRNVEKSAAQPEAAPGEPAKQGVAASPAEQSEAASPAKQSEAASRDAPQQDKPLPAGEDSAKPDKQDKHADGAGGTVAPEAGSSFAKPVAKAARGAAQTAGRNARIVSRASDRDKAAEAAGATPAEQEKIVAPETPPAVDSGRTQKGVDGAGDAKGGPEPLKPDTTPESISARQEDGAAGLSDAAGKDSRDAEAVSDAVKPDKAEPGGASASAGGKAAVSKEKAVSGVRVISRPTVAPGRASASGGAGGGRGSNYSAGEGRVEGKSGGKPEARADGREGRREWRPGQTEGAAARPYAPRPAGASAGSPGRTGGRPGSGGQDAPGKPGGYKGGRAAGSPSNAPRSAGGFNPNAGIAAAPAEGEGRGKKRQKSKRTVDFNEADGGRFFGGKSQDMDGGWMRAGWKRSKTRKGKPEVKSFSQPLKAAKRKIRVDEFIRVSDLARQMGLKAGEIIKVLFNLGVMATINQSLDIDTTTLVAAEFEYEVEKTGFSEEDIFAAGRETDSPEKLLTRPPVVTIMGHVDHGKTSLLDAIRKTSVTSGEAGGITQHIGAYHVRTKKGDIVFLDTPGHEAFTAMRARGAEVTDIVVLVVAADDGVMEQTREAINHAKAADVPIMVAVNKMDKAGADPDKVKRELADIGMVPEDWGGAVTFSYLSAKTRAGLDEFLELLALQAEILELKANPDKLARGHIVEAKLDKGRGALGTVLIQDGTLHVGDAFVCGSFYGRVRAMFNDQGSKVEAAGPSIPVEVQGFDGVPEAGEEFVCLADEKAARRIAEARAMKQRERELAKESKITLETFLQSRGDEAETLVLNLVVKADVQGSVEAIADQLKKLSTSKVRINIIHSGAGAVSESDVLLASTSEAIIIGFNVRPNPKTRDLAEQEKVDIRFYDIIYKLIDEIKGAMEGMLAPVEKEVALGAADVRETFSVPKVGIIAGCMVSSGKITRTAMVRLLRDGVVVYTGRIASLKRFKDDAREVPRGLECGIGIEHFNDIKLGDTIEAFEIVEEAATL
ncbi:MAG: translation initiation factor IF-2 [Deltaproteobacteria bacterium]|jgi:translation initiation factor IF-2|nr:translation initiation factor IF-2 [Deltaproteobacteria bacterium]